MILHLPSDFEQLAEYRLLKAEVGPALATHLVLRLWSDLAYAANDCGLGWLDGRQVALFISSLPSPVDHSTPFFEEIVRAGWLVEKEPGRYFSDRFEKLHPHLAPGFVPQQRRAAYLKHYDDRDRKAEAAALQQSLQLVPAAFRRPDGTTMAPDEAQRCMVIIKRADNATARPRDREPAEYTEGLMQSAWRLAQAWNDEQIQIALRKVFEQRSHPRLNGLPTERLIVDLPELFREIN